ncbi:MAG: sugar-binding protein [Bacillota bacterium]
MRNPKIFKTVVLFVLAVCLAGSGFIQAAGANKGLKEPQKTIKVVKDGDRAMSYLVQMPRLKDYKSVGRNLKTKKEKYPVILFLHGWGGSTVPEADFYKLSGTENTGLLLDHTAPDYEFPFIVIGPRLPGFAAPPAGATWDRGPSSAYGWPGCADLLMKALDETIKEYPVDTDRIYLAGFSMGGYGTWGIAMRYPELFAAAVPAAGGIDDLRSLYKLKHLPMWIFHSTRDNIVPFSGSQKAVDRLLEMDANVYFTIYPSGHSQEYTIFSEGTFKWLLRQNRRDNLIRMTPRVKAAKGTPAVDGAIDEIWNKAEAMQTGKPILGKDAAFAKFRLLWDDKCLYVLAEVSDKKVSAASKTPMHQDSVEFYVDFANRKAKTYDEACGQLRVSAKNSRSKKNVSDEVFKGFVTAVKEIEGGYLVEAAIPLFGGFVAAPGKVLGFDLAVNDDIGNGKREGITAWADYSGNAWNRPYLFGDAVLLP